MKDIEYYGISPQDVSNHLIRALTIDQELIFRLERDDMIDEIHLVREHARSCYKALASMMNCLEIEKYEKGEVYPVDFDVSQYCEDMFSRIKMKMRGSGIKFTCDIEKNLICRADPDRFAACLTNLIVNAYSWVDQEEGNVRVCVKKMFDYAVITVTDDGYGMTQQELEDSLSHPDGARGFDVMKRFCVSVDTSPIIETTENNGFSITLKIPLTVPDGKLEFRATSEILSKGLFVPSEVLIYKLDDCSVII